MYSQYAYYEGMGPHKLRTAFRSKCGDLGIPAVGEWQMGHGGEQLGYDLSGMDEALILDGPMEKGIRKGGLRQLWESSPIVDRHTVRAELLKRDEKMAVLEKQADTRDKEIKDLRIEIKRMQIREIEKRFNMGTTPLDIEIPDPSENPPITDEQEEMRKEEIEEYQEYKNGELAELARLKKELAKLESG